MFGQVAFLFLIASCALAAPQDQFRGENQNPQHFQNPQSQSQPQASPGGPPIGIISQSDVVNADGSFNYSYETANGIKVQESGYIKPGNPQSRGAAGAQGEEGESDGDVLVAVGSYSYTAPDGTVINLSYTADDRGFQPQGDHIPTIPPAIQRALDARGQESNDVVPDNSGLSNPAAQ